MEDITTLAPMLIHGEVILRLTLGEQQEPALMSNLMILTEAHTVVIIISLNMKSLKLTMLIHGASNMHLTL